MDKKYGANQFHFENLRDDNENIIGVKYRCHHEWEMRVLFNLYTDLILNYDVKKRYVDKLLLMKQSFKKQHVNNIQKKITELEEIIIKLQNDKVQLKDDKKELLNKILYELKQEDKLIEKAKQVELEKEKIQNEVEKLKNDNSELIRKIYKLEENIFDEAHVEPVTNDEIINDKEQVNSEPKKIKINDMKHFKELGEQGQNLLLENESVLKEYPVEKLEELITDLIKFKTNHLVMNSIISKFLKGENNEKN